LGGAIATTKGHGGKFMKRAVFGMILMATLLIPLWVSTSRFQDDSKSAKQNLKDAGRSTQRAVKKTAHKTKKTAKKGIHKSARKVRKGARKVERKTQTTPGHS